MTVLYGLPQGSWPTSSQKAIPALLFGSPDVDLLLPQDRRSLGGFYFPSSATLDPGIEIWTVWVTFTFVPGRLLLNSSSSALYRHLYMMPVTMSLMVLCILPMFLMNSSRCPILSLSRSSWSFSLSNSESHSASSLVAVETRVTLGNIRCRGSQLDHLPTLQSLANGAPWPANALLSAAGTTDPIPCTVVFFLIFKLFICGLCSNFLPIACTLDRDPNKVLIFG